MRKFGANYKNFRASKTNLISKVFRYRNITILKTRGYLCDDDIFVSEQIIRRVIFGKWINILYVISFLNFIHRQKSNFIIFCDRGYIYRWVKVTYILEVCYLPMRRDISQPVEAGRFEGGVGVEAAGDGAT